MKQPNLTYINKLSKEDGVFAKKLIDIIKFELPIEKELYNKNMNSRNFKKAAGNVHKIKHKISILSFDTGYVLATAHENNLNEGDNSLEKAFDEVLEIISNYLRSI